MGIAKRKNSRSKGKRSELEARDLLRSVGVTDAERGARNGVKGGGDIHSPTLARLGLRLEVKNVAAMRLGNRLWTDACMQAMKDSITEDHWAVLWRPCRGRWALTYPGSLGWMTIESKDQIGIWFADFLQKGTP